MIFAILMGWKAAPPSTAEGLKTVYADAHTQEEAEELFQKSHYAQNLTVDSLQIRPVPESYPTNRMIHPSMISDARKKEISLPADLLQRLKEALLYIETCEAVRGKALTEPQWDQAVLEFQNGFTARIGIGHHYTDKAFCEIAETRKLIKFAETQIKQP